MTLAFRRSLVLLLVLAGPARAADFGPDGVGSNDPPGPWSGSLWSGPWVGVLASGGRLAGEGALGGVAAGYAMAFDRVVIGVEGDVSGGGLDARRLGGRYEIEALGLIRARVGYAFDRFVAFGTAGAAFASAEFARAGERDRKLQIGWTIGGGVEIAITDDLSARAEYVYVDLDRSGFDAGGGVSLAASGGFGRVGLNYRF